ncbi:MAG: hypothetical protein ACU84H_07985 [Gammaproteobacteria bacterium]
MKTCPNCGHETDVAGIKCPVCGHYYSKIIELIDEEAQNEEKNSFRGRCQRIFRSDNIKRQFALELNSIAGGLSKTAKFTLLIVFIFIFALIVSVL